MNALDEPEPEPPVPINPNALGVVFVGFPDADWLESPLVAKAGCPKIELVAPDGTPKVKDVAGFMCVVEEVDILVAVPSFPNVRVGTEEDGPSVVLPGVEADLDASVVLEGSELSGRVVNKVIDFELSAIGPDVDLFSVVPLNANVDFDPSTAPPNTGAGLGVSAESPNVNVGFEPSAEPPKTEGGFELSLLPPNICVGLEPSTEAPNVNVGLPSMELPPNVDTGLEPAAAPPNKDTGLGPSTDLEPGLVPTNENTGALPEAGAPAGVEENVLLKAVVLADASVCLGCVDVEASLPAATGFPKRFVVEAESELNVELPKVDVPNGEGLAGSFEPAAVPKTDTGTVDFFGSFAAGSVGAEAPSVTPDV